MDSHSELHIVIIQESTKVVTPRSGHDLREELTEGHVIPQRVSNNEKK